MPCIIAGCNNRGEHNISIRCRREDTSAIWAPNTEAFLCDQHAGDGLAIEIILTPTRTAQIETTVSGGGTAVARTTPIVNIP